MQKNDIPKPDPIISQQVISSQQHSPKIGKEVKEVDTVPSAIPEENPLEKPLSGAREHNSNKLELLDSQGECSKGATQSEEPPKHVDNASDETRHIMDKSEVSSMQLVDLHVGVGELHEHVAIHN